MKRIIVLDFGSQYTQLIVRRFRELGYDSMLLDYDTPLEKLRKYNPVAIVLSGGPMSVFERNAPRFPDYIMKLNVPILGICYGLQLIIQRFGGNVKRSKKREFGRSLLEIDISDPLFEKIPSKIQVWMSHSDEIKELPSDFYSIAKTENTPFAAVRDSSGRIYGVQFHPEVAHTEYGMKILENFAKNIVKMKRNWFIEDYLSEIMNELKKKIKDERVIVALSGGVDSTIVTVLLSKIIGDKAIPIFIDTGFMRMNEARQVKKLLNNLNINIHQIDASDEFFKAIKGVTDPEEKRKRIGHTFISVFKRFVDEIQKKYGPIKYLAQGTLYPDVIESKASERKRASKIKTHHNVGGLPDDMPFELIEPFRYLFKDEVREIGRILKIPDEILNRHPFPGPGLAIRIVGEVTKRKVKMLQKADQIFLEEIRKSRLYEKVWQAFAVLLPIRSVGVMGDRRTYENVIVLRCVDSIDGMTADWTKLPHDLLSRISTRIVNEVDGINRVVYDITSKPPATIEWE